VKQLTEKHAKAIIELEKSHEATIQSMENRRCMTNSLAVVADLFASRFSAAKQCCLQYVFRRNRTLIEAEMAFKSHTDSLRQEFHEKSRATQCVVGFARNYCEVSSLETVSGGLPHFQDYQC
jgi:hypothetical protein